MSSFDEERIVNPPKKLSYCKDESNEEWDNVTAEPSKKNRSSLKASGTDESNKWRKKKRSSDSIVKASSGDESDEERAIVTSEPPKKKRRTDAGVRWVGGKLYDSKLGETCHWCRQKCVADHVHCSKCPIRFCRGCLANRHGEVIKEQMRQGIKWVCPKCRGGCGVGCETNCCNCGPCRKLQKLEPTGQLIREARAFGFNNIHDYLIYQVTGEAREEIEKRKIGRGWANEDPNAFCYDITIRVKGEKAEKIDSDSDMSAKRMRGQLTGVMLSQHLSQQEEIQKLKVKKEPDIDFTFTKENLVDEYAIKQSQERVNNVQKIIQDKLKKMKNEEPITKPAFMLCERNKQEPVVEDECERLPPLVIMEKEDMRASSEALAKAEVETEPVEAEVLKEKEQQIFQVKQDIETAQPSPCKVTGELISDYCSPVKKTSVQVKQEKIDQNDGKQKTAEVLMQTAFQVKQEKMDQNKGKQETVDQNERAPTRTLNRNEVEKEDSSSSSSEEEVSSSSEDNDEEKEDYGEDDGEEGDDDQKQPTGCNYAHFLNTVVDFDFEKQHKRALEHRAKFKAAVRRARMVPCSYAHLLTCAPGVKQEPITTNFDSESEGDLKSPAPASSLTEQRDSDDSDVGSMVNEGFVPMVDAGRLYKEQLDKELAKPFDGRQLEEMISEVNLRRAIFRHRETRQRVVDVETKSEGPSYLDHNPELAEKLAAAKDDEEKLRLLRGFFFWLQHACNPGAFKPWASTPKKSKQAADDCIEVDGPDCEITAVIVSVDERRAAKTLLRPTARHVAAHGEEKSFPVLPDNLVKVKTEVNP